MRLREDSVPGVTLPEQTVTSSQENDFGSVGNCIAGPQGTFWQLILPMSHMKYAYVQCASRLINAALFTYIALSKSDRVKISAADTSDSQPQ